MKKLRIAIFTGNYNHVPDGVSLTLNRLVKYLESTGNQVLIFAPTIENPPIKHAGRLVKVGSFSMPGREEYQIAYGFSAGVREELRSFKPDLVHIATPDLTGSQALLYCMEKEIPVVTSYHTHFTSYFEYYNLSLFKSLIWSLFRWFYGNCIHTYVPSESMAEELRRMGISEGLKIWARGIDLDRFNPSKRDMEWRRSLGVKDDEVLVSFVSRLVTEKETETIKHTFLNLHQKRKNIKTIIVGDGPASVDLKKTLRKTIFTGFLTGEELARAYASSDIFMFPSITETFGNVTLEAQACGVPTVVANAQGNKSLVQNFINGFLVTPRDIGEFSERIIQIADDSELRKKMSENALKFSGNFTWDNIFEGLFANYLEAIETYRKKRAVSN